MAIADAGDPDRLVIIEQTGTIDPDEIATYEIWLTELGAAEAVALQILRQVQGDMDKQAASVRSGSDAANHAKNMERIDQKIGELVAYMNENVGSLGLTTAGRELLARASSGREGVTTIVVDTFAGNRRRG